MTKVSLIGSRITVVTQHFSATAAVVGEGELRDNLKMAAKEVDKGSFQILFCLRLTHLSSFFLQGPHLVILW